MKTLTLLAALALVASPALAQNGFSPPPSSDPCDYEPCGDGDVLDMGGWVEAAEAVDKELKRQADGDPFKSFILWLADTFGPNIPTDPGAPGGGPGGGEDPGEGSEPPPSNPDEGSKPGEGSAPDGDGGSGEPDEDDADAESGRSRPVYHIGGRTSIMRFYRYANGLAADRPIRVRPTDYKLVSRYQRSRRNASDYRVRLAYRDGRRTRTILVWADGSGLYATQLAD